MMILIFVLMLLAVILVWVGYRRSAECLYVIMLVIAATMFYLDITSQLTIQL